MPALETHDRYQDAVLWVRTGQDFHGRPLLADPIDLKVRWVPTKREVQDAHGNTIAIDAVAVVDRNIVVGSLMWLGRIEELPGTEPGAIPTDVMYVVTAPETSDLKNRFVRRTVNLARYSDSLPP